MIPPSLRPYYTWGGPFLRGLYWGGSSLVPSITADRQKDNRPRVTSMISGKSVGLKLGMCFLFCTRVVNRFQVRPADPGSVSVLLRGIVRWRETTVPEEGFLRLTLDVLANERSHEYCCCWFEDYACLIWRLNLLFISRLTGFLYRFGLVGFLRKKDIEMILTYPIYRAFWIIDVSFKVNAMTQSRDIPYLS